MGNYKAYCFDGKGKVRVEDRLVAENDDQAIELALAIKNAIKLEVRDDRRVVTLINRQMAPQDAFNQAPNICRSQPPA